MHLSWLGLSAFKVETKTGVIVTDPYSPALAKKPLRAKADIVTVSDPTSEVHNHTAALQGEPFIIDHPGEYEIRGVFVQGISSAVTIDGRPAAGGTTIFTFDLEGMRLVHLGSLSGIPSDAIVERLNGVHVLFVPVGGPPALDAATAVRLINDIEPRMVVPMHFAQEGMRTPGKLAPVSVFLKEIGAARERPVPRLLLKKKDLAGEETRVTVFA